MLFETKSKCQNYYFFRQENQDDPTVNISTLTKESEDTFYIHSSTVTNRTTIEEASKLDSIRSLLVMEENLLDFLRRSTSRCFSCNSLQEVQLERIGSACVLQWVCITKNIIMYNIC